MKSFLYELVEDYIELIGPEKEKLLLLNNKGKEFKEIKAFLYSFGTDNKYDCI